MLVCDKYGNEFSWLSSAVSISDEKIYLKKITCINDDFVKYLFYKRLGDEEKDIYAYPSKEFAHSESQIWNKVTIRDWDEIYDYCKEYKSSHLYVKFHDEKTYYLRLELDAENNMLNNLNETVKKVKEKKEKMGSSSTWEPTSNDSLSTWKTDTKTVAIPNSNHGATSFAYLSNRELFYDPTEATTDDRCKENEKEKKSMLQDLFIKKEVEIGLDLQTGAPVLEGNKYFKDDKVFTTIEEFVYKTKGFLLSTAVSNINEGDIVWFDNSYVLITIINKEGPLFTGLKLSGETIVFTPTQNSMLGNTMAMLPKLYTLFNGMNFNVDAVNGDFNPMMLLMLKDRKSSNGDDLLEMMLLSQMMKGNKNENNL